MENQKSKFSLNLPALFRKKTGGASSDESKPWSGVTLLRKIMLVLISLLCAMLLWGYVLMSQNPDRTKAFSGVSVALESGSEADLLSKNLMVYGNIADILKDVTVTVSAPMKDVTKLTANDINATVNFNDVHDPGVTRLTVRATSSSGAVINIDPAYFDVEIEQIVSRSIPVDSVLSGELPDGYWNGSPNITPRSITIKGAKRDIEDITGAICRIDLTGRTKSINRSVTLQLVNEEGENVDNAVLIESIPSVNLQMQILPYKEVAIEPDISDDLMEGLEVKDVLLGSNTMVIACEQSVLDTIDKISTETVFLSDITGPGVYNYTLSLAGIPDDAVVIDGPASKTLRLTLIVSEAIEEKTFEGVSIRVTGSSRDLLYTYYLYNSNGELGEALVRLAADVTVTGPGSVLDRISASDIVLLLDVSGLGAGSRDIPLQLIWSDALSELSSIEHPEVIHVEIERA